MTSYRNSTYFLLPVFWFQPLLIVGFIFQFLTFFATFYYGFSKLYTNDVFSSSKDIIKLPDNAVVKEDLSSPEVSDKVRDSNSVILHRKLERIPRFAVAQISWL